MFVRSRRFAVPVVVAGLIAVGAAVPSIDASAAPKLPAITPTKLLAKAIGERVKTVSGTVEWSADLGLPALSSLTTSGGQGLPSSGPFDPTSLLSGTHDFQLWVDGAAKQRVAATSDLAETDLVRNGSQAWVWDSSTQHVTRYLLPSGHRDASPASPPAWADPQIAARDLLEGLGSAGSAVSVSKPVKVAGVSAYVLRVAPGAASAPKSTVSSIDIAVDAANGFPLRVSVHAAHQADPALELGFTSVSFATPAASVFAAPTGRTTTTKTLGAHRGSRATIRQTHSPSGDTALAPGASPAGPGGTHPAFVGKDWTAVAVVAVSSFTGRGPKAAMVRGELEKVTTAVSGSWGSGRLLTTSLLNALVLPNGKVLVGFVTPAVLEAAAAGR
jgi:outer membrane lipoprotein-sorting protein